MKITLVKISIILILLFSYCTIETIFLNQFSDDLFAMISKLQSGNTDKEMRETYTRMQLYVDEKKIWLDLVMPKDEQEIISVSMGKIRDYLNENKAFEARVAAGEIRSYLSDVNAPFTIKK